MDILLATALHEDEELENSTDKFEEEILFSISLFEPIIGHLFFNFLAPMLFN